MTTEVEAPSAPQRRYSFWREELRRVWCDLRGGQLSAGRVAASVAMGAFVGCLPIFGLHLPIVLVLSLRFRLDGALAYVAANISNPFFAPFLFAGEVQLGAFLLEGHLPDLGDGLVLRQALASFPKYLLVGAPLVASGAAVSLGLFAWLGTLAKRRLMGPGSRPVYRLPADAPAWVVAVEQVAARFANPADRSAAAQTHFHYVRIKLTLDPIARMIADLEGDQVGVLGEVFDLGSGRGQLPILLTQLGRATRAFGVDWDASKVAEGRRAALAPPPLDVTLRQGDARTAEIDPSDTVLLVDILHYFGKDEQDALLARAARSVRAGGRLMLREADTARGWRSWVTLAEEKFFTLLRFNRGERVHFRAASDLVEVLEREGLSCEVRPAWGKTPFSNVLIVARSNPERAPSPSARH